MFDIQSALRDESYATRKFVMIIVYILVHVGYTFSSGDAIVQVVWFCLTMSARFGLAAPLFTLDQRVHLTAPQGQGEGGVGRGAVRFRLTAKGVHLWQILCYFFVFLYLSQRVAFYWFTPSTTVRDTERFTNNQMKILCCTICCINKNR